MQRMLAPSSIAVVGLSADPAKHGGRVLANLRKVGFDGVVWGVNPRRPHVEGVEVFAGLAELPASPDLVVCAVPAAAVPATVEAAGEVDAGGVVVFAGGFAEAGGDGVRAQERLTEAAQTAGVPVLGPNSGGIIRPSVGLAASFLTCLDRPADQIRSGRVGLVTQSGGTGSYVHNLAAAGGGGLAVSISTGNEADLGLADGISALVDLDEVRAIALVMETVRDGPAFLAAVHRARDAGKPLVVCRIGTSRRGEALMATHTGALASPTRVLEGVLDAAGVTVTETPEEMLAVAETLARTESPAGDRVGVVTHSGGVAILLTDLAERHGVSLPHPGPRLKAELEPLLQLGSSDNPLDMGAIIGGPGRFAQVVDRFAGSGDYDVVLAVSTAHPPAHTVERVEGLTALEPPVPVIHLWMAGDVGSEGLRMLTEAGMPVVTEPRAAIRALAGLAAGATAGFERHSDPGGEPVDRVPATEHEAKELCSAWGLDVVEGGLAATADEAAAMADRLGGRLVVKISSPDVVHKTDVGGVVVGVEGGEAVRRAAAELTERAAALGARTDGVRVERMRTGVEAIVGMVRDPVFGPMALVGLGGIAVEGLDAERMSPAPLHPATAVRLVRSIPGLTTALGRTGDPDRAVDGLARMVVETSRRFVASGLSEIEMNPVVWTGERWEILDAVMRGR